MLLPDPDDVSQEVELQRLLGRIVTPGLVRRRVRRDEARRAAAERSRIVGPSDRSDPAPDPDRFPLLAARLAGVGVAELCGREGVGRQQLSKRLRAELNTYLGET